MRQICLGVLMIIGQEFIAFRDPLSVSLVLYL